MHVDVEKVAADAVAWRRHLHAHPELSFQEHETAAFVRERLASFGGLEIESPTPTSVVARLQGGKPGRTLALRADMDALPIHEESGVEFPSTVDGVMHACGHDGHTAMLLAVALLLTEGRAELAGEVRFLFQHAEEVPPGGAAELVAAGVLDGVDSVVGCHLISDLDVGRVAVLDGAAMAAADTFSARIVGRGGHAAIPHETVDPIAVAAQAISSLQQIVSRGTSPIDSVVVSVTRIAAGTADNIIPEAVEVGGTVRTFKPELRARTREAMARILDGVTAAHGATCTFDYREGYPAVDNDPVLGAIVRGEAGSRLADYEPVMGGEDFASYQRIVPGCFFFVGAGGKDAYPHHHPRFTIDEAALPVGIELMTRPALRVLGAAV